MQLPAFHCESAVAGECAYVEGRTSVLPLRVPYRRLTGEEFDHFLGEGDRRAGIGLYRTECPTCTACEPSRIPVAEFVPSRSQRRVWKRNLDLSVGVGAPQYSESRRELYVRHKRDRGLDRGETELSREAYEGFLVHSCTRTVEITYTLGEQLLGVGIVDLGARDASSVYFFFDPRASERSLGTFSTLVELRWWREQGGRHHYLGFYNQECKPLLYKANFSPQERLREGVWRRV